MSQNPTHGDEDRGFLDAASGIPMSSATRRALIRAWELASADPSRRYPAAARARQTLAQARASVAEQLGSTPDRVAFHSGSADEAMALAMLSAVADQRLRSSSGSSIRLVLSAVEALGVLRAADELATCAPGDVRIELTQVPVDAYGQVDPVAFLTALGDGPAVGLLQSANGEIGTVQPVDAVAGDKPAHVPLLVDARHSVGRAPLTITGDLVVAQASNWGGPPALSVLRTSQGSRLAGLLTPTDGPLGVEPTDPPVPLVAAAGLALENATRHLQTDTRSAMANTDLLRRLITDAIPDVVPLGHPTQRLAHIAMFSFLYVAADELVDRLSRAGWSVASGSACTSDTHRPLHVLVAIGALTHGNLRVSLPPWTTEEDIRRFAADLSEAVQEIRVDSGVAEL